MIWEIIGIIFGPVAGVILIWAGTSQMGMFRRAHKERLKYLFTGAFAYFVAFCCVVVAVMAMTEIGFIVGG